MEENSHKIGHGLIVGKFYPLTKGHQYLIETALKQCNRLTIAVSTRDIETIPQQKKIEWLTNLFPSANIVALDGSLPNAPSDSPSLDDFYAKWVPASINACGCVPDAVFTSEHYGDEFASYLKCRHILVDLPRARFPISASLVRSNPYKYWDFLDPVVRSYYVKTVCIYGSESCGKTTLCQKLADYYDTVWQPEYAREHLGDRHCVYEDMFPIAEGHFQARSAYLKKANKILFVDTDTITTQVYSEKYYGGFPYEMIPIIDHPNNQNDLYVMLTPNVPWVKDTTREFGDDVVRKEMDARFREKLILYNKRFEVIGDKDWDERFKSAINIVNMHIMPLLADH